MKSRIYSLAILILTSVTVMTCKKDDPEPGPAIVSFTPSEGLEGTSVAILGKRFSSKRSDISVKFNGTDAIINSSSPTQIVIIVPSGATTGKITVEINGATGSSETDFIVLLPPVINSFSPTQGISGATVTIQGTNFSTTPSANTVKFNGLVANVLSATSTLLTVTVPTGATTGKISVAASGAITSSAADFTVLPLPVINSFSPLQGSSGTTVTIQGNNFSTSPSVKFNGTEAIVNSSSATQIVTVVPAGATTGKITIAANGAISSSTTDFIIIAPPIVTSLIPTYGVPGAAIKITGNNFSTTPANNIVKFNGVVATVSAATETQLTVAVPPDATLGKISVTVSAQTSTSTENFEVLKDIPRNSLIVYYPFTGNGTEQVNNTPEFNFDMSDRNAATFIQDRFGIANQALNFDGAQSMILSTKIIPQQPWSISFWIKFGPLSNPGYGGFSAMQSSVGLNFSIEKRPDQQFGFGVGGGDGLSEFILSPYSAGYLPAAGSGSDWINITLTYNGNIFKAYKNGIEAESKLVTTSTLPIIQFIIGMSGGVLYEGNLDDVIVYGSALSNIEVKQLFEQTVSRH